MSNLPLVYDSVVWNVLLAERSWRVCLATAFRRVKASVALRRRREG